MSCCGFYASPAVRAPTQSESYSTTVSAELRLMPSPPERVVRRKRGTEASRLKRWMASSRSCCGVVPWMEQYFHCRSAQ